MNASDFKWYRVTVVSAGNDEEVYEVQAPNLFAAAKDCCFEGQPTWVSHDAEGSRYTYGEDSILVTLMGQEKPPQRVRKSRLTEIEINAIIRFSNENEEDAD